jgi:pyrophosphatase PpaX
MPRFQAVLFDLDGTLLDSVRLILDSYHHTMAAHGLPARSDADWLQGLGTPLTAQFREWAGEPEQLDALVATYRDYNLRHHDSQVTPYPGAVEMVRQVRVRGARTALVTSKNRGGALRGLRVLDLENAFDAVVGADDVTRPKPHPEPVLRALDGLGVPPAAALFVGDSVHDIASGRAAGVVTAAVLWGPFGRHDLEPAGPDHWLTRPDDLFVLL